MASHTTLLAVLASLLASGSCTTTYTAVTELVPVEEHVFKWTVPPVEGLEIGDWLESPTVELQGLGTWKLRAYPKGINSNDNKSFTVGSYLMLPPGTLATQACCGDGSTCTDPTASVFFSDGIERWLLGADLPLPFTDRNSTIKCVLQITRSSKMCISTIQN